MESISQYRIFAQDDVFTKIDALGDPLKELNSLIDWNIFTPILQKVFTACQTKHGGRKPYPKFLMFKILILQRIYQLSDQETEAQIYDRNTFKRFLGLESYMPVPDHTTIRNYREKLVASMGEKALFDIFTEHLRQQGFITKQGSIVDAQIIEVPKNHYTEQEKKGFNGSGTPQDWENDSNRLPQLDTDASFTKKRGQSYHGYKNHIKVDAESKLIDEYVVTTASDHDSQAVDRLLDDSDRDTTIWFDSAYVGQNVSSELEKVGAKGLVCERAYRNRPLTEKQKQENRSKSSFRSRVEHIFGWFTMQFGNFSLHTIGLDRANVAIGLSNLIYNMFRYIQLETGRALFRHVQA